VILYGHTHVQKMLSQKGKWIINPGSISRPRDGYPSYVAMKTDGNGGFEFEAKRL
jgi:predicted phosphodiesterase